MITITKEEQFIGPYLSSLVNEGYLVLISRVTGDPVYGTVTGYSRGGYIVNGEMIKERVQILTVDGTESHSIEIENISSITIPNPPPNKE